MATAKPTSTTTVQPAPAANPVVPGSLDPKKKASRAPAPLSTLILLVVLGVMALGAQLYFYKNITKTYLKNKQIQEQEHNQQNAQLQLASQLDRYAQAMQQINTAFPNETELIKLVSIINNRLSLLSSGQLKFDSSSPIKVTKDLYPHLPMTITASGSRDDIWKLVSDLGQNPYLILPQDLDIALVDDPPNSAKLIMRSRLYVNDSIQN